MPATNPSTHKFFESLARMVGNVGAGGVASVSAATIPHNFVGLTEGNAYIVTANRTDVNGTTKNPAGDTETFVGVASGDNFINCIRQVEGSAQAWAAGIVLEILYTAYGHNKLIEGLELEHNEDGTHKTDLTQELSNKTLIDPVINGQIQGTVTPPLTFFSSNFNPPEGFLINGKLVPSVAANNITLALKGMDGNDPSTSNPVYIRINGIICAITSALSVTQNAGIAGIMGTAGPELAGKEVDYFAYIFRKTSDGTIKLGFARIPYGKVFSDFTTSAPYTQQNFIVINSAPDAADSGVVVGRFAATQAAVTFNWSVPTFTSTNLIQRPIYETRWLSWQPAYSCSGSMSIGSVTTNQAIYRIRYAEVDFHISFQGTTSGTASNSINTTMPLVNAVDSGSSVYGFTALSRDGAGYLAGICGDQTTTTPHGIYIQRYDAANFGIGANRGGLGAGSFNLI